MSKECQKLHEIFNSMKRYTFPFDEGEIPKDGIYILFEKGEKAHKGDRIVRVGTHTGKNQLKSRLKQHFIKENKDRSIFRKNIGRALLNRRKDDYLKIWEVDFTTKSKRENHGHLIDKQKQASVEKEVSRFIQDNFSFVVFKIEDKMQRLILESKIISSISLCNKCSPSKNWLGLNSTKEKIRKSGLWLVNELYKEPLSEKDFKQIIELIRTK